MPKNSEFDVNLFLNMLSLKTWEELERKDPTMKDDKNDEKLVNDLFIANVIRKKFNNFGIKIHVPVPLLSIISSCSRDNPGISQVILKELLLDIKSKKGPIPEGYVITTKDFKDCYGRTFPSIKIQDNHKKYSELWYKQKKVTKTPFETDNLCDTPEWWLEVMK